ncbi:hypothetical protein K7X08_028715 [Anisodus acutangulus]|uniref:Uncharacterized protein n=1 Tax=Anisodus acutangulus TaxID=402998 RepID=A0A9Q1L2W7_9SOLA|nr:hypothetical protein K7X08_028715 [Anisodus acutangulus]
MNGIEQITSNSAAAAAAAAQGNPSAFPSAQGTLNAFPVAQGSSHAFTAAQGNVGIPSPTGFHHERPGTFMASNFKRWQQKMLLYLTVMGMTRFLTEDPPQAGDEMDSSPSETAEGGLDPLYTVYCTVGIAKELWEKLQKKYNAQDAGTKKFIIGKFMKFQIVDSKTLMSQVQEFQMIVHHLDLEGMKPNE